jgi:hypothetical protein
MNKEVDEGGTKGRYKPGELIGSTMELEKNAS